VNGKKGEMKNQTTKHTFFLFKNGLWVMSCEGPTKYCMGEKPYDQHILPEQGDYCDIYSSTVLQQRIRDINEETTL
jgi:hypothetical protein